MQKVTPQFENLTTEVIEQLSRAVRVLHGSPDRDLEQEAYLRTLQAFRRNTEIRHPQAFVWKIVKDTVADHWRNRLRHSWDDMSTVPERYVATRPDIDEHLDRKLRVAQLREAILELTCSVRGPVYLYYVENYSIKTLTRIYKKSPSAIKMALHRGRQQLFQLFPSPATNKSRSSLR